MAVPQDGVRKLSKRELPPPKKKNLHRKDHPSSICVPAPSVLTEGANVYLCPTNHAFIFCAGLLFVLGGIHLSPSRSQGLMEVD